MVNGKQHYSVISGWGGMRLGCLWDKPGKEGPTVMEERDVVLKSSSSEDCIYCNMGEAKTLMEIVKEGKDQGKSAYEALKETGFMKGPDEFL